MVALPVPLRADPLDGGGALVPLDRPEGVGPLPTPRPVSGRGHFSTDADAARRAVARAGSVAVDLETSSLHPHTGEDGGSGAVGAIILAAGGDTFILREFPAWWWDALADPDTKIVGTNLKFDLTWMIDAAPPDVVPVARNVHDCMLKSQIVGRYRTKSGAAKAGMPGMWEGNDLQSMFARYLGLEIGKAIDHDATDWTGAWSDEMVAYMLEDITDLERLDAELDRRLRAEGQEQAAWIEGDAVLATAWMTHNGITPDVPAWRAAIGNFAEEGQPASGWMGEMAHLLHKHLSRAFPMIANFNSPKQLMAAMPEAIGAPIANTTKQTLALLAPEFPKLELLREFRTLQTRLKNWGHHYLDAHVCGQCARFHPDWRQIGTETARYSCSRPNLQQIPRAPEFRRLFIAAEGCTLASLDYSAIEVLAAAICANEPNLLQACATGDPHRATAAMVNGKAPEDVTKEERQRAKIANFGLLFGGGADGLVIQARDLFGVTLTRGAAEVVIEQYYRLYPRLRLKRNEAYRAMDSEDRALEVRNLVGFRRVLEGHNRKPTSYLNSIIQSSAGHGIKASFRHLREAGLLPFLCAQVHDELIFEFPDDVAQEFAEDARRCMTQGMRDVLGATAPVTVDVALGRCWS